MFREKDMKRMARLLFELAQESGCTGELEKMFKNADITTKVRVIPSVETPLIFEPRKLEWQAADLAQYLRDKIAEKDPRHPLVIPFRGATKRRWAVEFYRAHKIDGRSWEDLYKAIDLACEIGFPSPAYIRTNFEDIILLRNYISD